MKKILFLSPLPPPHYGSAMSSEMCLNILQTSSDFEVKNIKLNYSKNLRDIGKFNLNKITGFLKVRNEIKNLIKSFKPDLIYFVPATSSLGFQRDYLFWKQIRKNYSGKIVFHLRSRILEKDWKRRSFRKKFSNMIKGQNVIILGKELISDVYEIIPKKNIFILPNTIKNEISQKQISKIFKERKKRISLNLLFLSNMDFSKGWPKLLQACKILKNQEKNFKCNFVGPFPGRKEKEIFFKFIRQNNLEKNINYLGKKIGNEKNQIYKNSDILIFPTEYSLETFGRVIIEGMMFGLPVIANGIATIPSIISHGKTGFVLKENSPKEIADFILILRNKKLREKFGKEARKMFLEKYEIRNYKKDLRDILNK